MITHGLSRHPLYKTWNNITQRAKKHKCYKHVEVCDDWLTFVNFYNWSIKNNWEKGLTIDRINSLGNYEPENCRWVTMKVQLRNQNRNRYFKYNNEINTAAILELTVKEKVSYPLFNKHGNSGLATKLIEGKIYAMTIYGFVESNEENSIDFLNIENSGNILGSKYAGGVFGALQSYNGREGIVYKLKNGYIHLKTFIKSK